MFFIVLDLRLTRLGYSGNPFFFVLAAKSGESRVFLNGFGTLCKKGQKKFGKTTEMRKFALAFAKQVVSMQMQEAEKLPYVWGMV